MVLFNHSTRELTAKIVYYGPGLCGKTTNLRLLHDRLDRGTVGRLLSLSTAQDRTIYFDLLPVELGNIKGYTVRFQLCTVPGQVFYNETRKLVLRGVDGIVFVVDSQWSMLSHNLESFQNLKENLEEQGLSLDQLPLVIQFNKRDLPGVLPVETLQESLGFAPYPFVDAVASEGQGVVETFRLVSKLTFVDLLRRLQKPGGGLELDPGVLDDTMPEDQASTVQIAPIGAFPPPTPEEPPAPPAPPAAADRVAPPPDAAPLPAPRPAPAAAAAAAGKSGSRAPKDDSSWLRLFAPREERRALMDQLGLNKPGKSPKPAPVEAPPSHGPSTPTGEPTGAPTGESPFETTATWLSGPDSKTGDVFADSSADLGRPAAHPEPRVFSAPVEAPTPFAPEPAALRDPAPAAAEPGFPHEREAEPAPFEPEAVSLPEQAAPAPGPEKEPADAVTAVLAPPAEVPPGPLTVAVEPVASAAPAEAPQASVERPEEIRPSLGESLRAEIESARVQTESRLMAALVPRDEVDELRTGFSDEMAGLRSEIAGLTARLADALARQEEMAGQLRALQAEVADARALASSAHEGQLAASARTPDLDGRLTECEGALARLAAEKPGQPVEEEIAALGRRLEERIAGLSDELTRTLGTLEPFVMRHEEDRTALRAAFEALSSREEGARQELIRRFEEDRGGLFERVELLGHSLTSLRQDLEAATRRSEERSSAAEGTSRKLLAALRTALEE